MIDIQAADRLLDFGARIGKGPRAREQLEGAVALHNILREHRVAYLADEVGMGKTYVALGALALFRHFQPSFRVLVIAPRENIQRKWMKELTNFAAHNFKYPDLRVSSIDRRPARSLVACDNLVGLVHATVANPNRDFFMRMSSFSLGLGSAPDSWRGLRSDLLQSLPWLRDDIFDLRNKAEFKDNVARAVCCALPPFDLVIVDEAHNLKHGFSQHVAARNRVMALAFGHPAGQADRRLFPGYGRRAKRVLFLSATPLEETYRHLWNQLDVFGLAGPFPELKRDDASEDDKKAVAAKFLIRRVTSIRAGDAELTKNQYRREWRRGGVDVHDQPIQVQDDRQRLVVALVQKKVSELLASERFNASYQIGMLASFESFLETAGVKRPDDDTVANFDDEEQTDDRAEREGIDVHDVNRIAADYRKTFGREMPHPKMDALVQKLASAWTTGSKSLVFVRRVASVSELKRRLDDHYDDWLIGMLRERLPAAARERFETVVDQYRAERQRVEHARRMRGQAPTSEALPKRGESLDNHGGTDTFFAWYFRGDGPKNVISGANVQKRFGTSGAYATFFEDNHVMDLLGARPGQVLDRLAGTLGLEMVKLKAELRSRAHRYLSGQAQTHTGADRMEAAQGAALELLSVVNSEIGERARLIWRERYQSSLRTPHAGSAPNVSEWLEQPTFFTELRTPERKCLRKHLWPEPQTGTEHERFRERELRAQLLATAARLGHAFVDLYLLTIDRLGSLDLGTKEAAADESAGTLDRRRIDEYLDLLDSQRRTPLSERRWAAFDELADIAAHFDLIMDVNAPDTQHKPLADVHRHFGNLLRQQQPIGGMSGQINKTLIQQFRMPGYPFVLITTDLLQEGEDLHTFCSSVHHYGISWTPSAMEQRTGRIDRVRSQTDRRLAGCNERPNDEQLLQVYYPHLEDTVEVLQVQRVLERMNVFLRLMHQGLSVPALGQRRIHVGNELIAGKRYVEPIRDTLRSAFPVPPHATRGDVKEPAVSESAWQNARDRFLRLRTLAWDGVTIEWSHSDSGDGPVLLGTARLDSGRVQPFALHLRSDGERLFVHCVSPVGRVVPEEAMDAILDSTAKEPIRLGAIPTRDERSYDLTVEHDVLLGASDEHDATRVGMLVRRVTVQADRLEQIHLPELDQPLETFQRDLQQERADAP